MVRAAPTGLVSGVKTFCSGAGGLQRALVLARDADRPPLLAYVDLGATASRSTATWFRGAGTAGLREPPRAFHGAPVFALLGGPGELCASRGSDATPSARPRAGRGWPTLRRPRRSGRSAAGAHRRATWRPWPSAASTRSPTIDPRLAGGGARERTLTGASTARGFGAPARGDGPTPPGAARRGRRGPAARGRCAGGALDRARRDLGFSCSSIASTRCCARPALSAVDR